MNNPAPISDLYSRAYSHIMMDGGVAASWHDCPWGNFMLGYAGRFAGKFDSDSRKRVFLAALQCAKLVLPIYEKRYPADNRLRECIETGEAYALGKAALRQLQRLCFTSHACSYDAAWIDRAWAASFAACCCEQAYNAAFTSESLVPYQTCHIADTAYYSFAYDAPCAREDVLRKCADEVRKIYPTPPTL